MKNVEKHLRESFPFKMPLGAERNLENIKSGSLFGYVQGDIEIHESLREIFVNCPPFFKIINVGRDDIAPIMKEYAEKEGFLTQPMRMLISRFFWEMD